MKALSIRQPWASLILKCGKDVENRCWPTKFRGRILIHAAKSMTRAEHEDAIVFASDAICASPRVTNKRMTTLRELGFAFDDLPRGGIIGSVEIVDCVSAESIKAGTPWFMGEYGFILRDPQPLPFRPWKGQLGFFEVPDLATQTPASPEGAKENDHG